MVKHFGVQNAVLLLRTEVTQHPRFRNIKQTLFPDLIYAIDKVAYTTG